MTRILPVATCQFEVSADLRANTRAVLRFVGRAADARARAILFPEGALSGYAGVDFPDFEGFDWDGLARATEEVQEAAREADLAVIVGSVHRPRTGLPRNSLCVIDRTGRIAARYDKRRLWKREAERFSPGRRPVTFDLEGTRCGLLICYDSCSPGFYEAYRRMGVKVLFHAYYNARNQQGDVLDQVVPAQVRTRAFDHRLWIVAANASTPISRLAACVADPDGSLRSLPPHRPGILVRKIPLETPQSP